MEKGQKEKTDMEKGDKEKANNYTVNGVKSFICF